ncbi:hypothetical protein HN803_03270 [candidate division WWE3 bacterium]|jgi:hypothetical protein|nr:hypothetical protein [candidate division WWE3 bacterium]
MKKIALILIIALVSCSGCYEFYFNDTPDNSITTPQVETPPEDIGEPIFEEPITVEDLVVENRVKTAIIAQRNEEIDDLEKLVMQKQKALVEVAAESDKIKDDISAIKSIIKTPAPTTKPSIEPHLQTIGDSSDKINDLITDPIDEIGPVDIKDTYPIDVPSEPTPYINIWASPKWWLGLIFGLLGLGLIVKFTCFNN